MRCWAVTILLGLAAWGLGWPGAARAATSLGGFPARLEGIADAAAPLAVDLDGDGRLELVAASRGQVSAFEADGSPVRGFPVSLQKGQHVATGLCAGAWGGARPTLLWGTPDGGLMALEGDGTTRPGFPREVGGAAGAPSLVDLDGDGRAEVLVGGRDGRLHALAPDGSSLPGFPAVVGASIATPVTAGRLTSEGELLLFFGDERGMLHAWRRGGGEAAGFPYDARSAVVSQPVLGDLDDDGRAELVFGAMDYHIHAVGHDGKSAAGFPVKTGYRIYAACALADLDGDGVVEVLATSGDGQLHVVDGRGRARKGFPVKVGGRPRSAPVVGDVDADGRPEIAVGSDQGRLLLLRADGQAYPGFPVQLAAAVDTAPLFADLTGGGAHQLAALARDGGLSVFKFLKKGKAALASSWPTEARDAARSGRTGPNPPRYVELAIQPARPATGEPLRLGYRHFDLDGDPEPATLVRWYRDGVHQKTLDGAREVPASATAKHQRWHFSLQAGEGARVFQGPTVEVVNTPPVAPEVRLTPEPARTSDDLRLEVTREAGDPDGDRIAYRVVWLREREPVKGLEGMLVPARLTRKGQRWTAVVTPRDGEADGPPARASLRVVNAPPTAPRVRLAPKAPRVTEDVEVVIEQPGRDPDGDAVRYLVRWSADGRELPWPAEGLRLSHGLAPKHAELKAVVTAFDGQDRGGEAVAQAVLRNSAPEAPRIAIHPPAPRRGDALEACVLSEAPDADRDPVALRLAWSRQGKALPGAPGGAVRIPAGVVRKGERWALVATPWDGEASGPPARAEVVVGNAPPPRPALRVPAPRPATDVDLVVELAAPVVDADGDPVSLEVVWLEDGREVARGVDLLRLPAARTRKHARYTARVTPRDGQDSGPVAEAWFVVQNSPPGACRVALEPIRPRTGQGLRARLAAPPSDPDGDAVVMRYAWSRDGEPIATAPGAEDTVEGREVRRGQRWRLRAAPFDGEVEGPACEAEVVVENQPPEPPRPVLEPPAPRATDALALRFAEPPRDPDGEPVALRVDWRLDGADVPGGAERAGVSAGVLRKGQRWSVEVVATDGELSSPAGRAEVVVVNSPPAAPRVAILPAAPTSDVELACALTQATPDPDGERVEHAFAWHVVSAEPSSAPAGEPRHRGDRLPAALTEKGQLWACTAVASDGALSGPPAWTSARIGNYAPGEASVDLQPASPGDDDELRCVISQPAGDPDGDPLRYKIRWLKDGVAQPFAAETAVVPARLTRPRDIWQCSVVATDGGADGPTASSPEVIVR